jgi:hypothetical protein
MSRFNTLMHGEPSDVQDELCDQDADNGELRAALSNAMWRIGRLEKLVGNLERAIDNLLQDPNS